MTLQVVEAQECIRFRWNDIELPYTTIYETYADQFAYTVPNIYRVDRDVRLYQTIQGSTMDFRGYPADAMRCLKAGYADDILVSSVATQLVHYRDRQYGEQRRTTTIQEYEQLTAVWGLGLVEYDQPNTRLRYTPVTQQDVLAITGHISDDPAALYLAPNAETIMDTIERLMTRWYESTIALRSGFASHRSDPATACAGEIDIYQQHWLRHRGLYGHDVLYTIAHRWLRAQACQNKWYMALYDRGRCLYPIQLLNESASE